jgi:ABC-type branched-subunit amino acid transport system substrate-binding protein
MNTFAASNRWALLIVGLGLALALSAAWGQKSYGPGVSDTEIKLGQTMPYSGPVSGLGAQGHTDGAYFGKLNEQGGINGRKVKLISLDDGYSPPKTVEHTRRLIEQEQVLALYHSLGTPTNSAIYRYVNGQKVPHLFILSGAEKFRDPVQAPWTVPIVPALTSEARAFARYIVGNVPQARIAVLYQNDDLGRDMLKGLKQGLGANAGKMIVAEASYEITDPTIDSQIVSLKGSGADTLMLFGVPRFTAQALKKAAAIEWKPLRFVAAPSANVTSVMKPVGPDIAAGVMAVKFLKDPSDSYWDSDAGMRDYRAFMKRYRPDGDPTDFENAYAYTSAQLMAYVLAQCGDDLTRENLMRQALSIKDLDLPLLLPGVRLNTSQTRRAPIDQFQVVRFDGQHWVAVGGVIGE